MLKIVTAPNSVLSKQAKPIGKIDKEIIRLIDEMKQTLSKTRDPEGVGLAASQVGKSVQLFIIKPTPKSPIEIFINPVITLIGTVEDAGKSKEKSAKIRKASKKLEGCLSLLNIWGEVRRSPKITIAYLDEKGKEHAKKASGFLATIIQHEYDHLQGILFPKRVLEQREKLYKSHKNEKNEDVFDEIEI